MGPSIIVGALYSGWGRGLLSFERWPSATFVFKLSSCWGLVYNVGARDSCSWDRGLLQLGPGSLVVWVAYVALSAGPGTQAHGAKAPTLRRGPSYKTRRGLMDAM